MVAAGLLWAPAIAGLATEGEPAPALPERVDLEGRVELDRTGHDRCFVAVPGMLEAALSLRIDTAQGTVTGQIRDGVGEGDYLLPKGCSQDEVAWPYDQMWRSTATWRGSVAGSVDREGAIRAAVEITAEFAGERGYYPGMPEYGRVWMYCSEADKDAARRSDSCPLYEVATEYEGELRGTLSPDGTVTATFEWWAPYCALITRDRISFAPDDTYESCPKIGEVRWTSITVSNQRPVIHELTVQPAKPVTSDIVRLTVRASDPDGDELTFQWKVDGDLQQEATGSSTSWSHPPRGDHTIEVRAVDPAGLYDDEAISVWVEDPPVSSEGAEDEPEAGTSSTATSGSTTTSAATTTTAITTTTTLAPGAAGGGGDGSESSAGSKAGTSAILAVAVAGVGEVLRKGQVRGKLGEVYRRGQKKVERAEELERKAERAGEVIGDPGILIREKLADEAARLAESDRAKRARRRFAEAEHKYRKVEPYLVDPVAAGAEEFRRSGRGQRAERRLREAEHKYRKAEGIARNPLRAALDRVKESRRGKRLERRARELADLDRTARRKVEAYVARIKARARRRVLDSSASRRYRRLVDRMDKRTKGILNAESTVRLIRAMGDPRRFAREVRQNRMLVRHVIRRARLSPLAVEALGGPDAIGRMLGRVARNPGRELRRVGRFLGRPKEWPREVGRGFRRVGRALRRLFGGGR